MVYLQPAFYMLYNLCPGSYGMGCVSDRTNMSYIASVLWPPRSCLLCLLKTIIFNSRMKN